MFYKKQVKHVYVMGITVVILINSDSFLMIFYPLYYFALCFIQVLYCYTPPYKFLALFSFIVIILSFHSFDLAAFL